MRLALHARVLVDRHAASVLSASLERWSVPVLEGRVVRLEPLEPRHEVALWEASRDPRTWQWLSVVQPQTRDEWRAYVAQALAAAEAGTEIPLVTLCHEEVAGSTRFLALRPEHGSVEIGWTWLHPSFWNTGANVEAKLLQLTHAFDTWGCSAGRAEDRRGERALSPRARGARGDVRGHPSQAHARPGRREPRQRLVQRHGRRLAGGSCAAAKPLVGEVDRPCYARAAWYPETELEHGR
jgi:RimJ/RimL family protein N-acetyltransferase